MNPSMDPAPRASSGSSPTAIAACHRALALLGADAVDAAREVVADALARWPHDPNVLYVAGNAALVAGDDATALALYEKSVTRAPRFPAALVNLGFLLRRHGRLAEARTTLQRCLALVPDDPVAWLNLTSTFVNEGEAVAGEAVAREALAHCPNTPDIRWNLGLLLLEQGRWREGWREYSHRFDAAVMRPPDYAAAGRQPPRLGSPTDLCAGQTVVCHGEQGLGDEILFAGLVEEFLGDVRRRGARLVLDCHPRLRRVFARNFPDALVPPGDAPAAAGRGADCGPLDWVVPIGDLAGFYRNEVGDFPDRGATLRVDPERVERLREGLASRSAGRPLVGIAWTGGLPWTHAAQRQIPLVQWLPVLGLEACFVSLEYRDRSAEIEDLRRRHGVELVSLPEITLHPDYDETFHLVAALDLVITVPTSVLHVAGAVATPCWVIMDERAAWRECSADRTIPWYPRTHERFVRDRAATDWRAVFRDVVQAWTAWKPGPHERGRLGC